LNQIAIVTDSTASLPLDSYERYEIAKVPYRVHIGDVSYDDTENLSTDGLCQHLLSLPDGSELPRTANPGPGDYVAVFRRLAQKASAILTFHLSSRGSGAFQAATVAKEMMREENPALRIEVIDTENVSMCHGWLTLIAARLAAKGASLEAVLATIREMIPQARMLQTADTLRYLYMGGRIGRAAHLVSSALHIKPIVSMEDGEIVTLGVARTRKRVLRQIAEIAAKMSEGRPIRLALTHAMALPEAETLQRLVDRLTPVAEVLTCELSPALLVHSGPGTVGLCLVPALPAHNPV